MEWPYASLRRGRLPADEYALGAAEYNMIDRPYGTAGRFEKYRKLLSYSGNTFTHNWMVDEKQNPTTGTPYAWVRARVLGGKTNLWGRVALRMSDYDFKAASRDGFGDDWPIVLRGHLAVLRQGRHAPRHFRHAREPAAASRQHLSAAA